MYGLIDVRITVAPLAPNLHKVEFEYREVEFNNNFRVLGYEVIWVRLSPTNATRDKSRTDAGDI